MAEPTVAIYIDNFNSPLKYLNKNYISDETLKVPLQKIKLNNVHPALTSFWSSTAELESNCFHPRLVTITYISK